MISVFVFQFTLVNILPSTYTLLAPHFLVHTCPPPIDRGSLCSPSCLVTVFCNLCDAPQLLLEDC